MTLATHVFSTPKSFFLHRNNFQLLIICSVSLLNCHHLYFIQINKCYKIKVLSIEKRIMCLKGGRVRVTTKTTPNVYYIVDNNNSIFFSISFNFRQILNRSVGVVYFPFDLSQLPLVLVSVIQKSSVDMS